MSEKTDPLEQAIEEARKALPEEVGNRLAAYIDGLEAQLSASRSEHREDEDAACRLEELRVKAGLPEGSPEEIAGSVGTIIELQVKALAASRSEVQALREALESVQGTAEAAVGQCRMDIATLNKVDAIRHLARSALSASQASTSAQKLVPTSQRFSLVERTLARTVKCPACNSPVGDGCRAFGGQPARYPHSERLAVARQASTSAPADQEGLSITGTGILDK